MTARRAAVVGTGLIGGSIGLALRERGWHVTGRDRDGDRAEEGRAAGAFDAVGNDAEAEITFIATPVGAVAAEALAALAAGPGVVTDVGSVKAPLVASIGGARFVGGHPMAGSEQEGLAGADPSLFTGAVWVLTPVPDTDPAAYTLVRSVVTSLGAEVIEIEPAAHDALVAVVSHVPHLAAAALMRLAAERAEDHRALLRLAAGGFRDMTRVSAGHPGIWPDICAENREAIADVLGALIGELQSMGRMVQDGDQAGLLRALERARAARVNLPARVARPEDLVEIRVPVPDRTGVLAEITTLATDLDVNIIDLEIAHSSEGPQGVLIVVVDADCTERLRDGLVDRGYRPAVSPLE